MRSLKVTLGMDVLRCKTADGVRKEVRVFGVAYNLVRGVMRDAADRQQVPVDRVSFVDAVRWLRAAGPGGRGAGAGRPPGPPGAFRPAGPEAATEAYPLMTRPRAELKLGLRQQVAA